MPKISELASGSPAEPTDNLVVQRGGNTYSVPASEVASLGGGGVTAHGDLTGLDNDDHPQYAQIADVEEITSPWTFSNEFTLFSSTTNTNAAGDDVYLPGVQFFAPGDSATFVFNVASGGAEIADLGTVNAAYSDVGATNELFFFRGGGTYDAPDEAPADQPVGQFTFGTWGPVGEAWCEGFNILAIHEATDEPYSEISLYFRSYASGDGGLKSRWRYDADGGLVGYSTAGAEATDGSQGPGTINCKGLYVDGVPANLAPTTVASLPAAGTAGAGARGFATDATATTFHSIVAGGGANFVPVFSDGTNWRIG